MTLCGCREDQRTQSEWYGCVSDSEGDGDRQSESVSGTCDVELHSTPIVFLKDTFTGKVCAPEMSWAFQIFCNEVSF